MSVTINSFVSHLFFQLVLFIMLDDDDDDDDNNNNNNNGCSVNLLFFDVLSDLFSYWRRKILLHFA